MKIKLEQNKTRRKTIFSQNASQEWSKERKRWRSIQDVGHLTSLALGLSCFFNLLDVLFYKSVL